MKRVASIFCLLGFVLSISCVLAQQQQQQQQQQDVGSLLECVLEENVAGCLRRRLARDIDRMELEVSSGKRSEPPMSEVIEQAGNFVAEVISDVQEEFTGAEEEEENDEEKEQQDRAGDSRGLEEARRKKFGKKKKKHLQKLINLAMLLKAKLSLILQLISTHIQVKFFIIAVIGLILNAARFWIDVKKNHQPSKVIYYEHAQHQHHYDHEDEHHPGGYWGRSSNDPSQDLAYNAYAPQK